MKNQQIINKTRDDYNIISSDFSQKRFYMWNEIKPYLKLIKKGDKVLDLGCGNGRLYGELEKSIRLTMRSSHETNTQKPGIDYLGIDFSKELISIAQNKYPELNFKVADILDTKIWDKLNNFDVVVSLAVLHHFPTSKDHNFILSKIFDCLKPNGIFILSVWNLWQKKFWKMHFKQLGFKIKQGFKFKWLEIPYHVSDGSKIIKTVNRFFYLFTSNELEKLCLNNGFEIIDKKYRQNFVLVCKKC